MLEVAIIVPQSPAPPIALQNIDKYSPGRMVRQLPSRRMDYGKLRHVAGHDMSRLWWMISRWYLRESDQARKRQVSFVGFFCLNAEFDYTRTQSAGIEAQGLGSPFWPLDSPVG